ncbi:glycerophosphodiester phosphodiesterase [Spirillospora sp. NPDC050679]
MDLPRIAGCAALGVLAAGVGAAPQAAAAPHAAPRTAPQAAPLPACPKVFVHASTPKDWRKDQIRQPNTLKALSYYRGLGAVGVEADVKLTKVTATGGGKAVMWHNKTTNGLTGPSRTFTDVHFSTGKDRVTGRRVARGPFKGSKVPTLREWLDHARRIGTTPLIEIKPESGVFLVRKGNDAASRKIRERAWKELADPIRERHRKQPIMLYSHDPEIRAALQARVRAGTFPNVTTYLRIAWPEDLKKHPWTEPPSDPRVHRASWAKALKDPGNKGIATDYPKQLIAWLKGRCA